MAANAIDPNKIIEIIQRRRDAVKDRCEGRVSAHMHEEAQIDWFIVQEYDALIAEIESLDA